jgi:glyoxylase-like metal-dependent hydrolase (beta-lactamase superfamily II)
MPVKSLKIIKQGTISWEAFEAPEPYVMAMKRLAGSGDGSTVTYIESDKKIIVDTGFEDESDLSDENIKRNESLLKRALKDFGIKPKDIDMVFITHLHRDHFGNLGIFKHSEIVASEPALKLLPGIRGAKDGAELADGVRVMYTPGHTADHASLVLDTERLRYRKQTSSGGGSILGIGNVRIVVAGDAIITPGHFIMDKSWEHNPDLFSAEQSVESMNKIIEVADFIVPGHGGIFKNVRKPKA